MTWPAGKAAHCQGEGIPVRKLCRVQPETPSPVPHPRSRGDPVWGLGRHLEVPRCFPSSCSGAAPGGPSPSPTATLRAQGRGATKREGELSPGHGAEAELGRTSLQRRGGARSSARRPGPGRIGSDRPGRGGRRGAKRREPGAAAPPRWLRLPWRGPAPADARCDARLVEEGGGGGAPRLQGAADRVETPPEPPLPPPPAPSMVMAEPRRPPPLLPRGLGPVRVGFYDIEGTLGKGNFAVVKLARHRITRSEVRRGEARRRGPRSPPAPA